MKKLLLFTAIALFTFSCKKDFNTQNQDNNPYNFSAHHKSFVFQYLENFENGSKNTYTNGTVKLTDGIWQFNDALIGTTQYDIKQDIKAARIRNAGSITMQFDLSKGASMITLKHALYTNDPSCNWSVFYSVNAGNSWILLQSFTSTSSILKQEKLPLNIYGNIRLKIQKTSGTGRLNIDEISIEENNPLPTKEDNSLLGNPSNATNNTLNTNNYLMQKNEYNLSYNNSKGTANWVSWHLSMAWKGNYPRKEYFNQDNTLPTGYFKANAKHYANTGFDKGHICPSEDRDLDSISNRATFLMTNMLPQAPKNNQVVWKALEKYCQDMAATNKYEMYIYAGGIGTGGIGSKSNTIVYSLNNGTINVPSELWKIIVLLPVGSNDLTRINANTRVIAVSMPNTQTSANQSWDTYRVSVDYLESKTGYDFLSNLPVKLQYLLEQKIDNGPTVPEAIVSTQ